MIFFRAKPSFSARYTKWSFQKKPLLGAPVSLKMLTVCSYTQKPSGLHAVCRTKSNLTTFPKGSHSASSHIYKSQASQDFSRLG